MEDIDIAIQILEHHDTKCFEEIIRKYSGLVFSKALCVTHNNDMAAEITQQTFIKAYINLSDWKGKTSMGPWLTIISMHLALNYIDKERRMRTSPIETDIEDEEYSEEHEQKLKMLEAAIKELPEQDRKIIELHYYKERKTDDIAEELNMTSSNVLVRLHRIREHLKSQLNNKDYE